jgi:hypothetical protein
MLPLPEACVNYTNKYTTNQSRLIFPISGRKTFPSKGTIILLVTPPLAAKYAGWLAELGINALEVSCGTLFSCMNMCRGKVPVDEMV